MLNQCPGAAREFLGNEIVCHQRDSGGSCTLHSCVHTHLGMATDVALL